VVSVPLDPGRHRRKPGRLDRVLLLAVTAVIVLATVLIVLVVVTA
jgi:hypothetical protein